MAKKKVKKKAEQMDINCHWVPAGKLSPWDDWWTKQPEAIRENAEVAARAAFNVGLVQAYADAHKAALKSIVQIATGGVQPAVPEDGHAEWRLSGREDHE